MTFLYVKNWQFYMKIMTILYENNDDSTLKNFA